MILLHILFALQLFSRPEEVPQPQQLRTLYYDASQSSRAADKFYGIMKETDAGSPLLLGYKGMAEFMKCYHSLNPVTKLSYFGKGKSNLDQAIQLDPDNIELRYLRFTVQTNIPFLLNYSSEVDEDKQVIIKNFSSLQDEELKQLIREYMLETKECSDEERRVFQIPKS